MTPEPIEVEHTFDAETPPSIAIVRAIAAIENVDPRRSPMELGITLYDHLDPGALDRLVTANGGNSDIRVELSFRSDHRYEVQIHESGQIVVCRR